MNTPLRANASSAGSSRRRGRSPPPPARPRRPRVRGCRATPARSWPAAGPAPPRGRRAGGGQGALGGRDDLRRLGRVVRAGPDRRDVVGADHAGGQLRVAQLLGRRDRRHPLLAGRLQAAAARSPRGCAAARPSTPAAHGHRSPPCGRRRRGLRPHLPTTRSDPRAGVEVVGLVEDVRLQAAQRRARVHPELLDEQRPRPAQHRERVALAAGAVERERQQPPGVLAPRVLGDVRVEVRDGLGGAGRGRAAPRPAARRPAAAARPAGTARRAAQPRRRTRRTRARATSPAPSLEPRERRVRRQRRRRRPSPARTARRRPRPGSARSA